MARTLWLLRHGDAEPHGLRDDFARRLTERGCQQARAAGRALARLEVGFEHVFSSPRVRALETARLACAELGIEPIVHDPLSGGFDQRDADELLFAISDSSAVLLVGHEPDLSQLVAVLTGSRIDMKKGGLAALRGGVLLALLRPREIEFVAGR